MTTLSTDLLLKVQFLFSFSSLYPVLEVPNRPAAGREEVREVEQHSHETYGSQMNYGNFCSLVLIEPPKATCS